MSDLAALQKNLGITFRQPPLLQLALVHRSYINENPDLAAESNERLEFLGDAVLGLIIAEKLYHDFPQSSEGEMTRLRAALVRQDTLARIARTIRLGEYLHLGKGERASGGQQKPANLARTLEAVIAAIFLDQGIAVTRDVTLKLFDKELQAVASHGAEVDYKSQLQEFIQARGQPKPIYQVVAATGPDHEKLFTIEVKIGDAVLGTGSGKSKKLAEAEAARIALQRLSADFTH